MMLRMLRVCVIGLCALLSFARPSAADPTDALALGLVLNQFADRVDSSIQRAGAVADHLELRAGSEVYAAIQNARITYKDALDETINTLTPAVRVTIDQLRGAVDALERQTALDAQRAIQFAQQVTNSLPLSNKQPQLTRWEPQAEVATKDGDYRIALRGNFFYAAQPNMRPYLISGTDRIEPIVNTTQQLVFVLPRANLLSRDGKPTGTSKFEVVVPYREPRLFDFDWFARNTEARFAVAMTGLPQSPGVIKVVTYTPQSTSRTRRVITTKDNQQSDRDDKVEVHCGPTETDHIVHNSVRFVVDRSEGDTWTHRPERYDNPSVCEWIRTEHHGIGTSDKAWFHFEYDVSYSESTTGQTEHALPLRWGDSNVISLTPTSTYRVFFDSFDGTHYEAAGPDHANRYIDIDTTAGGLKVSARNMMDIPPQ